MRQIRVNKISLVDLCKLRLMGYDVILEQTTLEPANPELDHADKEDIIKVTKKLRAEMPAKFYRK